MIEPYRPWEQPQKQEKQEHKYKDEFWERLIVDNIGGPLFVLVAIAVIALPFSCIP